MKNIVVKHKHDYYNQLTENIASPQELWRVLNSFVKGKPSPILPNFDSDEVGANAFATFFYDKILNIRESFFPSWGVALETALSKPLLSVPFPDYFDPVRLEEAVMIINIIKPMTSLSDPILT